MAKGINIGLIDTPLERTKVSDQIVRWEGGILTSSPKTKNEEAKAVIACILFIVCSSFAGLVIAEGEQAYNNA